MKVCRVPLVVLAAGLIAACSDKAEDERHASRAELSEENEQQPHEDEVAEDCVAFVRATKVVPAPAGNAECPSCPPDGIEVLRFQSMKTDRTSCSATACEVEVTIRASFNPGAGESIGGGLTAWILPEQRSAYLRGEVPPGEQAYRVKITYKRAGEMWRAIEFDRVDPQGSRGTGGATGATGASD